MERLELKRASMLVQKAILNLTEAQEELETYRTTQAVPLATIRKASYNVQRLAMDLELAKLLYEEIKEAKR